LRNRYTTSAEGPPSPARRAILLRYARPTKRELEGRPNILDLRDGVADELDPRKAREAKLRRNSAIHELTKIWRDATKAGQLDQLPPDIRFFVEGLIRSNGGKLPKPRIGRPRDRYRSLRRTLIYLRMQDKLAACNPAPRKLQETLKAIAKNLNITSEETGGITINTISYAQIREIYYDRSPEFRDAVFITVAMRELLNEVRAESGTASRATAVSDLS
jgi:hypothetical protein